MKEQESPLSSTFKGRTWTRPDRSANTDRPDGTGQQPCFGLERGNRFVRRFRLLFTGGSTISIPYAHLPVILYSPERGLRIRTGEMEVTVKGRGLDVLAGHLNEEKVLWIKESPSGTDTDEHAVFVSEISVEGELLE